MYVSGPKPKLRVYEIHHGRADLPNPYISWTRELPSSSREQRGKKWLARNGFELEETNKSEKRLEGWPWRGMGKEENRMIRSGFRNPDSVSKVARARARAEKGAWEKEKEKFRALEEEDARLRKEEELRASKATRARQREVEARKAMQESSETQERIQSERQKVNASLPAQQQPIITGEVVSPKPRRFLGDLANALGRAVMLDRNESHAMRPVQERITVENADSNTRRRAQEQYISKLNARSQPHTQQSTVGDAKWSLGYGIKNTLNRVGARQKTERKRGEEDAKPPAQELQSTKSSNSSGKFKGQAQQNISGLDPPLKVQAARLSTHLNG